MKSSIKKKNNFFKKFKKILKKLLKIIVVSIKSLWESFMGLSLTVRYVIGIWAIVLFLIVGFVFLSSYNTKMMAEYSAIEKSLDVAALDYVKTNNVYPVKSNPLKLSSDAMINLGYLYESDITDKTCYGYSLIYFDDKDNDYHIESYLNCKKYITEGYSKN